MTGFRNRPDRFGLSAAVVCVFRYVCVVVVGCVLLQGPVALQWLRGLGKKSLWRRTSEIGFKGRILE
jgi:hypothetical protein